MSEGKECGIMFLGNWVQPCPGIPALGIPGGSAFQSIPGTTLGSPRISWSKGTVWGWQAVLACKVHCLIHGKGEREKSMGDCMSSWCPAQGNRTHIEHPCFQTLSDMNMSTQFCMKNRCHVHVKVMERDWQLTTHKPTMAQIVHTTLFTSACEAGLFPVYRGRNEFRQVE